MTVDLQSGVLVVWWAYPDSAVARLEPYLPWLSTAEQARRERFRFERDRHRFLASRILLRRSLGDVLSVAPADVCFADTTDGKPKLDGLHAHTSVHFNLTHTDGLVACVLSRQSEVGIDAEDLTRAVHVEALAARVLSPRERDALAGLGAVDRAARFLQHWCVKEAVLKATGTGLRVPAHAVDVQFDGPRARLLDAAHRDWDAHLVGVSSTHVVAVAHRRQAAHVPLRVMRFSLDDVDDPDHRRRPESC